MIATLMLQALLVSALLALGAMAAERLLRLWRKEARVAWVVAMGASVGLPLLSLAQAAGWMPTIGASPAMAELGTVRSALLAPIRVGAAVSRLDIAIGIAWLAASLALTIRFASAAYALGRRRARWRAATIDGQNVFVSRDAGPAVVGFRRPVVVVPEWVLGLSGPLRTLVLRHEREHLEHNDPRWLLGAVVIATLAPWNPLLWFQLYRLRSAMELDCDGRVLRAHPDARRYGALLLAVAQRADRGELLQAALTESHSLLARRIRAMRRPISRFRAIQTALLTTSAVLAGFVACELQSPTPPKASVIERPAPAVAQGPYFEFQVEQPVVPAAGTGYPRYPDVLRRAGIEGEVLAQFIVGPDGRAEVESFKVLKTSDARFSQAVRNALPQMRFRAARVGDRSVRQLVQQPFTFSITK